MSQDNQKVKRSTPYVEPKDVDERTIYIESLPSTANHDWLRDTFSAYGDIVYTSLPRYQSTGDLKGFAFVEFQTIESAEKACKVIHNLMI